MAKSGKRALVPSAWEELAINDELIQSAFGRAPTDEESGKIERVRCTVEIALNAFENAPLVSVVEAGRNQLDQALESIESIFERCDRGPGLFNALAGSMRRSDGLGVVDAITDLQALREVAKTLRGRIDAGSMESIIKTNEVEPRTFRFRVLLYELAPLAKSWGFVVSEKSPRFADLVQAFGLYETRTKTENAIKNNKKKVLLRSDK
jgi:hypothetical protein